MKTTARTTSQVEPQRSSRRDHGTTFIELLVSIVILGTAGIAVLTAVAATVRATTAHDQVATAQAQLADAGDILTDVTYDATLPGDPHYDDCATPLQYNSRLATEPDWSAQAASWPDVTVIDVEWWDDATNAWISSPCINGAMQKITLQATVDSHTRQLTVVKRQGTEAVGPGGAWDDDMVTPNSNPGF